jgi:D-alanyl-D-alanine dipeptidase
MLYETQRPGEIPALHRLLYRHHALRFSPGYLGWDTVSRRRGVAPGPPTERRDVIPKLLSGLAAALLAACAAAPREAGPGAKPPADRDNASDPTTDRAAGVKPTEPEGPASRGQGGEAAGAGEKAVAASAPGSAAASAACQNPPPAGFADLRALTPPLRFEIRYATADNFTGAPLPGYRAPGAFLLEPAAEALAGVAADLSARGLELLIYDSYRPARASAAMWDWAERTAQRELFEQGYIARRSGHNLGNTVDLTLVDEETGAPLEMGTPYDHFGPESAAKSATGEILERRLLLREAMRARGFSPYEKEWWHFSFPAPKAKSRDVPYGCDEAAEASAR